jgi:ribulose-5-phosphate 4-epimerase/fuculose-1-phosphate aldolase
MLDDKAVQTAIDELVVGNHILYDNGVFDCYGHLSARHPIDPQKFLLAWAIAPGIVQARDILTYDLAGTPLNGSGQEQYSERFIHSEIYAMRPDVMGVVHSHSSSIIPFTIVDEPLRPVWHVSSFLDSDIPTFDPEPLFGDTDLLVRTPELGKALAQQLGNGVAVLMRGHGSAVVGRNVREAVYRAFYTEVNARIQSEASRFGKPIKFLSAGEAALMNKWLNPDVRRPWELWRDEAAAKRATTP